MTRYYRRISVLLFLVLAILLGSCKSPQLPSSPQPSFPNTASATVPSDSSKSTGNGIGDMVDESDNISDYPLYTNQQEMAHFVGAQAATPWERAHVFAYDLTPNTAQVIEHKTNPDGTRVQLRIQTLPTGDDIEELNFNPRQPWGYAQTSKGKLYVFRISADGSLHLESQPVELEDIASDGLGSVVFDATGSYLVATLNRYNDSYLLQYRVKTPEQLALQSKQTVEAEEEDSLTNLTVIPKSNYLVATQLHDESGALTHVDGYLQVWQIGKRGLIFKFSAPAPDDTDGLSQASDGRAVFLSARAGPGSQVWSEPVRCVAYRIAPDGHLNGALDTNVNMEKYPTLPGQYVVLTRVSSSLRVKAMGYLNDQSIVAGKLEKLFSPTAINIGDEGHYS